MDVLQKPSKLEVVCSWKQSAGSEGKYFWSQTKKKVRQRYGSSQRFKLDQKCGKPKSCFEFIKLHLKTSLLIIYQVELDLSDSKLLQ